MAGSVIKDIKSQIISLHLKKNRPCDIIRKLRDSNVNRSLVNRTIKRFYERGDLENRKSTGCHRTVRTPGVIKKVRERMRRKGRRSVKKMAKELKISRRTLGRIINEDLGLKAYKRKKIHALTIAQKKKRVQRSKIILDWHAGDEIIFSDEKLFVLEETYNAQNDRIYVCSNLRHSRRRSARLPISKRYFCHGLGSDFEKRQTSPCVHWQRR